MNKHKILIAFFGTALVFTACKKNDVQNEALQQTSSTSQSKTVSSWSSQKQDDFTEYSTVLQDKNITEDIASKGLVLAYKKTSDAFVALPYSEKTADGSYSWYYQISDGNIAFAADAYEAAKAPSTNQNFSYLIFSEQKLNDLEGKGISKAQLMKLSYKDAAALLK
jgi:hypothetical protein